MDTQDRFSQYYGTYERTCNNYEKSKQNKIFNNLWRQVLSRKNILYAFKRMSTNPGRNTPGPDGLKYNDIKFKEFDKVEKEILKHLHGRVKPEGRTKKIPKKNGKYRTLGIANIYDRLAQQCIYNILEPIVEAKYYPTNYGYRRDISAKKCIADIWQTVFNTFNGYVFDADITSFFDNVHLDDCLNSLRKNFGVKDKVLLQGIKMIMSMQMDGKKYIKGLVQGSILGPLLANVLLHDLEVKINDVNDYNYHINKGHKEPYALFAISRRRFREGGMDALFKYEKNRRSIKIMRYADDFILYSNNPHDIYDGIMMVEEWCKEHHLKLNMDKSKLISLKGNFTLDFLGYKIRRRDEGFIFSVKDSTNVWKTMKKKLRNIRNDGRKSPKEKLLSIQSVMNGYFHYYSFTTNTAWLCDRINQFLYKNMNRLGCKKVEGKQEYYVDDVQIGPWLTRQMTKDSIKNYVKNTYWDPRDAGELDNIDLYIEDIIIRSDMRNFERYKVFIPGLIHRDKIEPITGEPYTNLDPEELIVHHIRPLKYDGTTEFMNLVVLHKESHKLIHYTNREPNYGFKVDIDYNKLNTYRKKATSEYWKYKK